MYHRDNNNKPARILYDDDGSIQRKDYLIHGKLISSETFDDNGNIIDWDD